ncbi:MAG: hypothetical protein WC582_03410 [Patescibacteria group bacterium]|jgi:hypothetical protein
MKFVKRLFPGPLLRRHLREKRLSDKRSRALEKMTAEANKNGHGGKRRIEILIPPIY